MSDFRPGLQHRIASPVAVHKKDAEYQAYAHVLSDADQRLQELEAQRLLEKIRLHAKQQAKKARWAPPERDESVRRSLSRPLLTKTNVIAKEITIEQRRDHVASIGLSASAVLASPSSCPSPAKPPTSPIRPGTAPASRLSPATRLPPPPPAPAATPRARVPPPVSAASHVTKLEKEVAHLKETIGVLLESQPRPKVGKRPETAPKYSATDYERIAREHDRHMDDVEAVVEERRSVEERLLKLEKQGRKAGLRAAQLDAQMHIQRSVHHALQGQQSIGNEDAGVFESKEDQAEGKEQDTEITSEPAGGKPTVDVAESRRPSAQLPQASLRPQSADGRMQGITQALGFSFGSPAAGQLSITQRRAEEERKKREAEEAAHRNYKFIAKEVPESAKIPLFGMIMARMETRRKLKHEARFVEMKSTMKPFRQLMEHEQQLKARIVASRARHEMQLHRELNEGRKFRAIPIPDSIKTPDGSYIAQIKREEDRSARVSAAARSLAATASLPPRMAIAEETEKKRRAEREAKQKAEEITEKRLARFHANGMPDFDELHQLNAETIREKKKSFGSTVVMPFGFDSEERKAAEAARKAALRRESELNTSTSFELRARSRSAHGARADLAATSQSMVSAFAPDTPGRRSSLAPSPMEPLESTRRHSIAHLTAAAPPPAAMTKAVRLRMLEVQRRVREKQERERQQALEEELRKEKVKSATRAVAPIIQQLEAQRNPIPLAWQQGAIASAATVAKEAFEKQARENAAKQRERIAAVEASRPLLFMRTSMDVKRDEARRSALMEAAKTLGAPSSTSWRDVVEAGVEEHELFDQQDRDFLGVSRRL